MAKADAIEIHAAQARLLENWRGLLAGGATRLGWKIGVNDPRAQRYYGLPHSVVGFMTGRSIVAGAGEFGPDRLLMTEPELAIRIDGKVDAEAGPEAAVRAIGAISPAMEILDFEQPRETVDEVMAHNIFHLGVVFGAWSRPDAGTRSRVRLHSNGLLLDQVSVAESLPPLCDIVHLIARTLAAHGENLEPGDVIISGALMRPAPIEEAHEVDAEFEGLGRITLRRSAAGRVQVLPG